MEFALSFSATMRAVMTPILAGPRRCRVTVESDELRVRMGIGGWAFSARVPRSSIVRVVPVSGPIWAWGAHGWGGRWLVNGSSRGLVQVGIAPTGRAHCLGYPIKLRELTLSLEDPDGFVAVLSTP